MRRALLSATLAAACAQPALAQSVAFRIVERTGQGSATPNGSGTGWVDPVLDIAIQAQVTGGRKLGGFSFDAVIVGEADTRGTLAMARINNADGTYATTLAVGSTVGQFGIARQYSYLAGISPSFNGVINTSVGTFTNTPGNQEIGLIAGAATGSAVLGTPGLDVSDGDTDNANPGVGDGNPDSWNATHPWSSVAGQTPPMPANNDTGTLAAALAGPYFGAGQFIDIYRFRYTLNTSLVNCRTLHFTLVGATAQTFDQLLFNNGSWGAQNTTFGGTIFVVPLDVVCFPAPSSAALLALGGLPAARRRRV